MVVVARVMIHHARRPRMDVSAPQIFRRNDLAGRCLHQGRTTKENRALLANNNTFVAHRRHIGTPGRARPHHDSDLRNPLRRHIRLVEENPAEMLPIRENLVLHRQERPTTVDQVQTR
jgi:hypothetical protein